MATVVKVTRRGQTTIPKELRKKYGIKEGDNMIVSDENGRLIFIHVPKLEDLAGVDSDFGNVSTLKKQLDRLRESS